MAATKGKFSSFARASKDRLSGRRLIQPSEKRKQTHVHAFTSENDTKTDDPDDENEKFLHRNSNAKDNNGAILSHKAVQNSENCCIICVGSTGAGKSSTITKLTGQHVPSGNSAHRITQRCNIYRPKVELEKNVIQEKKVFFVDTVGWDDAECDDDDTFKEILRFIESNSIVNIKAVLWSVIPSPKRAFTD